MLKRSTYIGDIPGPLTVEYKGLQGALHKNEQIIVSLLVGGGCPQSKYIYIYISITVVYNTPF